MKHRRLRWGLIAGMAACSQAGTSSPVLPYPLGQALVIGSSGHDRLTVIDDGCNSAECAAVREQCGAEAYADVLLDQNGEIAQVICLRSDIEVNDVGGSPIDSATVGNGTLLVLDGEDDGFDVTGDVVLSGDQAIVHGRSAAAAVIGGNLVVSGSEGIVRQVTVRGDVIVEGDDAQLAFIAVEGNLTIRGDNATLGGAVILGELRVDGDDALLVYNRVQGAATFAGDGFTCNANVAFADANADGVVDDAEVGAELICPEGASGNAAESESESSDADESSADDSSSDESGSDASSGDDSNADESNADESSADESSADDEPAADVGNAGPKNSPRKPRARAKPAD